MYKRLLILLAAAIVSSTMIVSGVASPRPQAEPSVHQAKVESVSPQGGAYSFDCQGFILQTPCGPRVNVGPHETLYIQATGGNFTQVTFCLNYVPPHVRLPKPGFCHVIHHNQLHTWVPIARNVSNGTFEIQYFIGGIGRVEGFFG